MSVWARSLVPRPRRSTIQRVRLLVLWSVFVALFVLPLSNLARHAETSHGAWDLPEWLPPLIAWLGTDQVLGSIWTFTVFGLEWVDAWAMASLLALGGFSGSWSTAALVAFIPTLLLTAIFGRVFCGWICPMRLALELVAPLKRWLRRRFKAMVLPRWAARTRYLAFGVFVAATLLSQSHAVSLLYPPALMTRVGQQLVFFSALHWALGLLAIYLVVDALWLTGFWCRYLCPGGVLYSLLGRFRPVTIRLQPSACNDCGACALACPYGLDPTVDSQGMECDNCGRCISQCKPDALAWRILRPGSPAATNEIEAKPDAR
jgi:ferredoxin-type protein NapH